MSSGRLTVPILHIWNHGDINTCGSPPVACPMRDGTTVTMGITDCIHEPMRQAIAAQGPTSKSKNLPLCVDSDAGPGLQRARRHRHGRPGEHRPGDAGGLPRPRSWTGCTPASPTRSRRRPAALGPDTCGSACATSVTVPAVGGRRHMTETADATGGARRVALVANTDFYVGPPLARVLAARGHDLVVGDPQDGLVDELEAMGAAVEVVDGVKDLSDPAASERLVAAGLARFGRIDAAARVLRARGHRPVPAVDDRGPAQGRRRMPRGAVPLPQGGGAADGRAGRRPGARRHERVGREGDSGRAALLVGARGREPSRAQRRRRDRAQRTCR